MLFLLVHSSMALVCALTRAEPAALVYRSDLQPAELRPGPRTARLPSEVLYEGCSASTEEVLSAPHM